MMLTVFMLMVTVVVVAVVIARFVSVRVVVPVRALLASDVDVATLSSVKYVDLNYVENKTQNCGSEHNFTTNFRRVPKPHSCLIYQQKSHDPYREDGNQGAKNFHAMIPVAELVIGISLSYCKSKHRQSKSKHV